MTDKIKIGLFIFISIIVLAIFYYFIVNYKKNNIEDSSSNEISNNEIESALSLAVKKLNEKYTGTILQGH